MGFSGISCQRIHLQYRRFNRHRFSSCVKGRSPGEWIGYPLQYSWASLASQMVKICLRCKRPGFDPWVGKLPWRRERLPTPVFWPGGFHRLYSPWGYKESDMTKQLSLFMMFIYNNFTHPHKYI